MHSESGSTIEQTAQSLEIDEERPAHIEKRASENHNHELERCKNHPKEACHLPRVSLSKCVPLAHQPCPSALRHSRLISSSPPSRRYFAKLFVSGTLTVTWRCLSPPLARPPAFMLSRFPRPIWLTASGRITN